MMDVLRGLYWLLRCPVWILRGQAKGTDIPLTVLFGGRKQDEAYFAGIIFNEGMEQINVGKQWRWQIRGLCSRGQCDCTILPMISVLHSIFGTNSSFFVPQWVTGIIGTDNQALEGVRRGQLRGDLNRLRKNQLDYEISESEKDLKYLYNRMYAPYTRASHGEATLLMKYPVLKKRFSTGRCDLMFITKGKRRIAGGLIVYDGVTPVIKAFGVLDAERQYLKDGVFAARYYFTREHLNKLGFSTLDVGSSRAYLKDGVLRYKSKWGLNLVGSSREGFQVTPLNASEGARQFFNDNPFIYKDKCSLHIASFEGDTECGTSVKKQIREQYPIAGIADVNIFTLCGDGDVHIQDSQRGANEISG